VTNIKSIFLGLLFCLGLASFARAQMTIDVSKISCREFVTSTLFEPDHIALWLNGYYNGARGNTALNVSGLKDYLGRLNNYCLHNQEVMIMKAAETILSADK
jgi:acid stress chaperone HdeB